jgi:hypothetical protein
MVKKLSLLITKVMKTKMVLNARRNALMISLVVLVLTLASCGTSRKSQKAFEIKNQISWAIEFKPGTTEDDRIKALAEIKKQILDDINDQDASHEKVLTVSFKETYNFQHPEQVLLMVILNGERGTEAKISVKPVHVPKKISAFTKTDAGY